VLAARKCYPLLNQAEKGPGPDPPSGAVFAPLRAGRSARPGSSYTSRPVRP